MEFTIEQNRIYNQDEQGKLLAELLFPREEDGTIAITRVYVDESLRGQGVAGQLMQTVIAEIQAQGQQAKAVCPYAVKWFENHPEYLRFVGGYTYNKTCKAGVSMNTKEKYEFLRQYLAKLGSVAVAFSGGVDSTFLLKTAHDILGSRAIAVTARSCSFPERELKAAAAFCDAEKIMHIICDSDELNIEGFADNPPNRCYLCKKELLGKIWAVARQQGIEHVAEGSNTDDDGDYRPGLQAVAEQGVKSPLREVLLSKDEIRAISEELGLPTWDKQSFACLASRFPYGQRIDKEKLLMVERAEQLLLDMGLKQVRVRYHGDLARIETDEAGFALLMQRRQRELVYAGLRQYGFIYIALDLLGYRTGSMNETLKL